jgi:6,7-dimethyl-8-ribityllumazine synthase
MESIDASMDAAGMRFGVVVARWNELVTKQLLEGALETLKAHGDPETVVVHVPGAWEIPAVVRALIEKRKVNAVVALGCILQGATPHAELLAKDVSSALMRLQVETGVPIAWGILTPDTPEQALERAGLKMGNKGREAAQAAVAAASVLKVI